MTVRELFREFAAERIRARDRFDRDTTQAWQVVRIYIDAYTGKMPKLDTLLSGDVPPERKIQTRDEQIEALRMLSGFYGGKLITVDRRKAAV